MGRLYDVSQKIDAVIERKKLDRFKTRGQIAMKTGFPLGLIGPASPDDEAMIAKLRDAASLVLGETF